MSVNDAQVSEALEASLVTVQQALASVDLSSATPFQLSPVAAVVNEEIAIIQDLIAEYDADMITTSVAGIVPGSPAPTLWPILLNQVADSVLITQLLTALGYLQRLAINLSEATGTISASA